MTEVTLSKTPNPQSLHGRLTKKMAMAVCVLLLM